VNAGSASLRGKDLKRGSALNLIRRVCAPEGGVENSAGTVQVLMEGKAYGESRAAGAILTPKKEVEAKLIEFLW